MLRSFLSSSDTSAKDCSSTPRTEPALLMSLMSLLASAAFTLLPQHHSTERMLETTAEIKRPELGSWGLKVSGPAHLPRCSQLNSTLTASLLLVTESSGMLGEDFSWGGSPRGEGEVHCDWGALSTRCDDPKRGVGGVSTWGEVVVVEATDSFCWDYIMYIVQKLI